MVVALAPGGRWYGVDEKTEICVACERVLPGSTLRLTETYEWICRDNVECSTFIGNKIRAMKEAKRRAS